MHQDGIAVAGEDRTAGIEDELGPCVRQEVAVEEVVIPVVVPRCPTWTWAESPPTVEAFLPNLFRKSRMMCSAMNPL